MASRRILEDFRLFKDNGDVCTDGSIAFYQGGTTTPLELFSDRGLSVSIGTSEACDVNGYAPAIFASTTVSVKVIITGTGCTSRTIDYYAQAETAGTMETGSFTDPGADRLIMWDESAGSGGSAVACALDTGLSISGTTLSLDPEISALAALTSADGAFIQYSGSGSARTQASDILSGLLFGLTLSNNGSDATNDIDVAAGIAIDGTNVKIMRLAASITKRLDASWAVGTNQGGLDTGSIADTTYHVWLIMRSDTGVVDVLFSASASSPTMPANYDYKRRIGSIVRASSAIKAFKQSGDIFTWTVPPASDYNTTNPGTSAVSVTLTVPTGITPEAIVNVLFSDNTPAATSTMLLSALETTDTAPSGSGPHSLYLTNSGAGVPNNAAGEFRVRTNASAQIRMRISLSTADHGISICTKGWVDNRGRLA